MSTAEPHPLPALGPRSLWILRSVLVVVPMLLAVAALRTELRLQGQLGFPLDDPYIHFQFARNLAHGHGFAFNPGELSPGATSPLWVLLLAGGHALGAPIEWLSIALGVAAMGAAALLAFEVALASRLSPWFACIATLAATCAWRATWASLSGMETALAMALSLGLLSLHLRVASGRDTKRRALALGLIAGLCTQARPEMLLLATIVGALELARHRSIRASLTYAASVMGVLLPYVIFCLVTSGRPLPSTFYAKAVLPLYQVGGSAAKLRADYLPIMARWLWFDNRVTALLVVPGAALWAAKRTQRRALGVLLWPLAFWSWSLALAPQHFNVSRYTIPLLPCLALLAVKPIDVLVKGLRNVRARTLATTAAGAIVLAGTAFGQVRYGALYQIQVDNILSMQVRMARWVSANLPPTARVATNDVGAITFYGGRYCIDTWGLVSPGLITHELKWKKQHGSYEYETAVAAYLAQTRPDYCILFPTWYPNLTRQAWLQEVFRITYSNRTGGGNDLVVYRVGVHR